VTITPLGPSGAARVSWQAPTGRVPWRYVVLQVQRQGQWETFVMPFWDPGSRLLDGMTEEAVLWAVGRTGIVSERLALTRRTGRWVTGLQTPSFSQRVAAA